MDQMTICEACGKTVSHALAAWTDDGASHCDDCLPGARDQVEIDRLRDALRRAVSALEMVTDQNAIKSSTVANAFAACVEAAARGRNVLADQNPVKSAPEAQDEGER